MAVQQVIQVNSLDQIAVTPGYPCSMPFDNSNIPRFWHSQRTRDDISNIFDQSTLPEYKRQKHQAAG